MKSKCCNAEVVPQNGYYFCSHCIGICKIQKTYKRVIGGICLLFLLVGFNTMGKQTIPFFKPVLSNKVDTCDIQLKDSCLLEEMQKLQIAHAEIAIKQFHLETANFTSNVCKSDKNLAGIKYIGRKLQEGKDKNGYAIYSSYRNFLKDYKISQSFYIQKLGERWAEDPNYSKNLKK